MLAISTFIQFCNASVLFFLLLTVLDVSFTYHLDPIKALKRYQKYDSCRVQSSTTRPQDGINKAYCLLWDNIPHVRSNSVSMSLDSRWRYGGRAPGPDGRPGWSTCYKDIATPFPVVAWFVFNCLGGWWDFLCNWVKQYRPPGCFCSSRSWQNPTDPTVE